jgi:putative membrane protein
MLKMCLRWVLMAVALLAVTYLYSGVQVASFGTAMLAALVIGLLNVLLRPILILLTLPVTVLTLGLFLFIVNALVFWAASGLMPGFHINGFWAALLGSLIYSALGLCIDAVISDRKN